MDINTCSNILTPCKSARKNLIILGFTNSYHTLDLTGTYINFVLPFNLVTFAVHCLFFVAVVEEYLERVYPCACLKEHNDW